MKLQKVRQNSYKGEVNNLVKNFERLWKMTDRCYQKLSLYDDTVEKLNNTASELNDKLSGIESDISECVSSVTSMNKTLTNYGNQITALGNEIFGVTSDCELLKERFDYLEGYIFDINTLVNQHTDRIIELSDVDTSLLQRITPFENADIINKVSKLESAVSALQSSSGDSYDDSELVNRIDTLETQVGTNTTSISTLSTNVDNYYNTNARNITTLSNNVSTLSDSLDTTNSNVEAIENQINNLGTLYSNQVQVTTVNNTGTTVVSAGGYCTTQFVIPDGLVLVGLLGFTINSENIPNLRVKHYFVNNVEYPYIVGCYVENLTDLEIAFEMTCIMATLPL